MYSGGMQMMATLKDYRYVANPLIGMVIGAIGGLFLWIAFVAVLAAI
jgi:hypothetical protein